MRGEPRAKRQLAVYKQVAAKFAYLLTTGDTEEEHEQAATALLVGALFLEGREVTP